MLFIGNGHRLTAQTDGSQGRHRHDKEPPSADGMGRKRSFYCLFGGSATIGTCDGMAFDGAQRPANATGDNNPQGAECTQKTRKTCCFCPFHRQQWLCRAGAPRGLYTATGRAWVHREMVARAFRYCHPATANCQHGPCIHANPALIQAGTYVHAEKQRGRHGRK